MTTRLSSRFSLRSSSKSTKRSHKGIRFWFSSKTDNSGDDLVAAAAAQAVDEQLQKTKQRSESGCSYVPRVEYGSSHCGVERDAPWTSNEQVEQHYSALGWTVVPIGPVRRLRVTNEDVDKHNLAPPPYRILHLLYKDDHYSSLHSNDDVKTIAAEEYTVIPTDKRVRSPAKTFDSPDKKVAKVQETKVVHIQDVAKKAKTSYDPSRKNVKFQEVVEAKPSPRESKAFLYEEENLPECGVLLPKQVLFKRGKRRVSGATLFSLVHIPSTGNLKPVVETTSVSTSSDASTATSSSEEQEDPSEMVTERPKPKAPTLRAVAIAYPRRTTFHKGRATTAC
ncbi:hypothetical protein AM587_10010087 [Phytophthora nicotianae]|uniref:Uncharacterized protein n=1 Tax=Phytophthora nicotianae TaxID=4792 RepID=A0A0W8C0B7_PHYNI|nr:hypothetical protein AM587_10012373 [Phytophthora nicotianae]KUF83366.1 hypothetical protein AM587_10010087 [Phytophthora nicotianae]